MGLKILEIHNHGVAEISKRSLIVIRFLAGIPGGKEDEEANLRRVSDGYETQRVLTSAAIEQRNKWLQVSREKSRSTKSVQSKLDLDTRYPPMFVGGYYDNGHLDMAVNDHYDKFSDAVEDFLEERPSEDAGTPVIYEIRIVAEGKRTFQFIPTNEGVSK
jgi:hypothetical protein